MTNNTYNAVILALIASAVLIAVYYIIEYVGA